MALQEVSVSVCVCVCVCARVCASGRRSDKNDSKKQRKIIRGKTKEIQEEEAGED